MDSFAAHPANEQQVDYNQEHYGQEEYSPYAEGDAYAAPQLSPTHYGAVHSNLPTAEAAALHSGHPPMSPSAPYTDSPLHT